MVVVVRVCGGGDSALHPLFLRLARAGCALNEHDMTD